MALSSGTLRLNEIARAFPTPLATWSRRVALFSLQLVLLGIILHRVFSLPTPVALNLFLTGFAGAAISVLLGLAAIVIIWRQGCGGALAATAGILIGLLLLAWPAVVVPYSMTLPKMNDVTTDAQVPPRFVQVAKLRPNGANSPDYPGATFSRLQMEAYPDIRPVVVARPAAEVFEVLEETVRRLRWDVVATEAPQGRGKPGTIEAVERTLVLGFYDDIAIRIDGDQRETRIDIRSASRYGQHDLGRNAARVRGFFKELQSRLEASVTPGMRGRRSRPGAAVPKRQKGGPALSSGPQKSQGRAQPGAQRGPQSKERPRSRAEDQARDKRSERYPR
jgi:uncharacterized protein (DUF1499 family)